MRQFLYLVVANYDEETYPRKIFFQEREAIQWGKKQAQKAVDEGYGNLEYALYKQEITRKGELKFIKTLMPIEREISGLALLKKQLSK